MFLILFDNSEKLYFSHDKISGNYVGIRNRVLKQISLYQKFHVKR